MHVDHRKLGRELDLFDSDPLIGAGLPFWLPAGAAARHEVESYLYELERRAGYQHVYSPALGKKQMVAVIGDSGSTPSIRLHASCGFRLVGTLENIGFKFGRWLDSVLMQRPLGEG